MENNQEQKPGMSSIESKRQISAEELERIKKDAHKKFPITLDHTLMEALREGYITGASEYLHAHSSQKDSGYVNSDRYIPMTAGDPNASDAYLRKLVREAHNKETDLMKKAIVLRNCYNDYISVLIKENQTIEMSENQRKALSEALKMFDAPPSIQQEAVGKEEILDMHLRSYGQSISSEIRNRILQAMEEYASRSVIGYADEEQEAIPDQPSNEVGEKHHGFYCHDLDHGVCSEKCISQCEDCAGTSPSPEQRIHLSKEQLRDLREAGFARGWAEAYYGDEPCKPDFEKYLRLKGIAVTPSPEQPEGEIPEEIEEWIGNASVKNFGEHTPKNAYFHDGAIAMYRHLLEEMPKTQNPRASYWFEKARQNLVDRNDFKGQLSAKEKEIAELKTKIREFQEWHDNHL